MTSAPRLDPHVLAHAPADIARPGYDRDAQKTGVVHLGTGAFHRAHQAAYFDALMGLGERDWMIQGASLRSQAVAADMNPQGGLYTLVVRDGAAVRRQVIGSVCGVLVAPQNPAALVSAMADPGVSLVTLTITEKGYKPTRETGGLLDPDPDVQHDVAHPDSPRTALGLIAAALAARKASGAGGLTILSCDNLPENGQRVFQGVVAFAAGADPHLPGWIRETCAFPSSMVDRIVPAATPDDLAALEAAAGYRDEAMVKTEPFTQWVIEDWFAGRRPPLERVGVQFTKAVHPWEAAKLRLLNGAHSAIAYLGALSGLAFVSDVLAAPSFAAFVETFMDEAEASLTPPPELDVARYRADLLARFRNAALAHRTAQIAMDGSQKLPQRLLNTARAHLAAGTAFPAVALGVAAWMRWQLGRTEAGEAFVVDDPLAGKTADLVRGKSSAADIADALLTLEPVFGGDLGADPRFRAAVTSALAVLLERGAAGAVRAHIPTREAIEGAAA